MRGGTVLYKGHLAPASRYSEDIDLVLTGKRPARRIKLALARVLEPLLGHPSEAVLTHIQLAVRNLVAKSKIIRTAYTYDPLSSEAVFGTVKIEVNINDAALVGVGDAAATRARHHLGVATGWDRRRRRSARMFSRPSGSLRCTRIR